MSTHKITIYNLYQGEEFKIIETCSNNQGIFSYSMNDNNIILVFPSKKEDNIISVNKYSIINEEEIEEREIKAQNGFSMIKINQEGNKLAIGSANGQYFTIYDLITLNRNYEFKRGSEIAEICNMEFSQDNKYFICSSSRGTLHIFKLLDEEGEKKNPVKFFEKISSAFIKIGDGNYITKQSSFARLKFEIPSICAFIGKNKILAVNTFGCLIGEFDAMKGERGTFHSALNFN